MRGSFTIEPRGPFSLAESVRFLEGFAPAGYETGSDASGAAGSDASGAAGSDAGGAAGSDASRDPGGGRDDAAAPARLEFACALEGSWQTVGVSVTQEQSAAAGAGAAERDGAGGGTVTGRVFGPRALGRAELSAARGQVERILSLDVDGGAFAAVGEQDAVVGRLQRNHPGLRPVCFWSWYEAAAWSIIGQRTRMVQAAAVKRRMAEQLGEQVEVNGSVQYAFPSPKVLAGLDGFAGLTAVKVERLRALGEAARRNVFSSEALRAMPRAEALEALRQLPGIGPFSAELILLRGAGDPDSAPVEEPRLAHAVAHAYGLPALPEPAEIDALAQQWAPYRTWVSLLLRVELEESKP